jgi:hypothetical protein
MVALAGACTQLERCGSGLREICISEMVPETVTGLIQARGHQLFKLKLPLVEDNQAMKMLPALRAYQLEELNLLLGKNRPVVDKFFSQGFDSLRSLQISTERSFSDMLGLLSACKMPKIATVEFHSMHHVKNDPLWGPNGAVARFTKSHAKSLTRLSLDIVETELSFEGFTSASGDLATLKDTCAKAHQALGIPLRCIRLCGNSALNNLIGDKVSIQTLRDGYIALYGLDDSPAPPLAVEGALDQCAEFLSWPEEIRMTEQGIKLTIAHRNRIRSACPSVLFTTSEDNNVYLHLCLFIMECFDDQESIDDAWKYVWECLEYDQFNASFLESIFHDEFFERLAQEPKERLQRLLTSQNAAKYILHVGEHVALSPALIECASSFGPLPFATTQTVIAEYLKASNHWTDNQTLAFQVLLQHAVAPTEEDDVDDDRHSLGPEHLDRLAALPMEFHLKLVKFLFGANPRKIVAGERAATFQGNREKIAQLNDYTDRFMMLTTMRNKGDRMWVQEDLWIDAIKNAATPEQLLEWADVLFDVFGVVPVRIQYYLDGEGDRMVSRTRFPSKIPKADSVLKSWFKSRRVIEDDEGESIEDDEEEEQPKRTCSVM